jgi:DNA-binding MarR family transcriptional regulator
MARDDVDEALLEAARTIMRISLQAADRLGGVSVVQLRALTVLHRTEDANLAQLAEGMGVTVSTTSRLVDRLVAAGLVDRRTAEHTRREIALRLTGLGRATLDRYDELRVDALRGRLDTLPEAIRTAAVDGLRAIGERDHRKESAAVRVR